jgi:hypothetical protein
MAELFGFQITRKKQEQDPKQNFTTPQADDGTTTVAAGGYFGSYLDMEGTAKNEADLVRRYREISLHPECDQAIEDICNEAIVSSEEKDSVRVILEDLPYGSEVKKRIDEEFLNVLKLMNFSTKGFEIFKRWYVDGRIFYQKLIDRENPKNGLTELRYIDPRKIKKVREIKKSRSASDLSITNDYEEYFMFNEKGVAGSTSGSGVRIAADTIAFCSSGLVDQNKNMILSYLHKAIKPVNQLRMIEDAVVIYRIARAPERRIFKIDVGNLPKQKAEQYLRDVMARYRNKLVYDANTGEIRDDRSYMNMLEDYWLPTREGGRGTDITTLPGGQNLGEMADIEYFQRKLYRSLNVPVSRLEPSTGFSMGRSTEITRDELKFTKFVQRLRKKFTELFNDFLKTQLILKGIIAEEDWSVIQSNIKYDFLQDGHFAELKESEMLKDRVLLADSLEKYVGKYFSQEYIRKFIFKQSEKEIKEQDKLIKSEGPYEPTGMDTSLGGSELPKKSETLL